METETRVEVYVGGGCIGCGLCSKNCPANAIDSTKMPPVIRQDKCIGCGACADVCPPRAIMRDD